MDGYWALDHGLWDVGSLISTKLIGPQFAVSSLTDPSITDINFNTQILLILMTQVSPPTRACALAHRFLILTGRTLESPFDKDMQLIAICSAADVPQAFKWIREQEDPEDRVRMREGVWCWALGAPRSPCGIGSASVQSKALKEILHLPLQAGENAHLVHFLTHPPRTISPPALSLLHDLVTLRLIHQGQYAESLQLDRELAGSGGNEEDRQRRREMVRHFIAILPEAQRRALLVESEATASRKDEERRSKTANGISEPSVKDIDMGGSWIDVNRSVHSEVAAKTLESTSSDRPTSLYHVAQAVPVSSLPDSPVVAQNNSPFAGPPRFATFPGLPISPMRNIAGSPFKLPMLPSSHRQTNPRRPRQIINDDDHPVGPLIKRKSRDRSGSSQNLAEEEGGQDENIPPKSEFTVARPNRHASTKFSQAPLKEPSPSPPISSPSKRTRNRQPTTSSTMPGAFTPEPETVPEEEVMPPPVPSSLMKEKESRSRPTRNATKAILDDEENSTLSVKRAKSNTGTRARKGRSSVAASEIGDDGATGVRRSTRRAGTAQLSERGSPTPSMTPSVGGRSNVGSRRRMEGRQTPGMTTRSKRV